MREHDRSPFKRCSVCAFATENRSKVVTGDPMESKNLLHDCLSKFYGCIKWLCSLVARSIIVFWLVSCLNIIDFNFCIYI